MPIADIVRIVSAKWVTEQRSLQCSQGCLHPERTVNVTIAEILHRGGVK